MTHSGRLVSIGALRLCLFAETPVTDLLVVLRGSSCLDRRLFGSDSFSC